MSELTSGEKLEIAKMLNSDAFLTWYDHVRKAEQGVIMDLFSAAELTDKELLNLHASNLGLVTLDTYIKNFITYTAEDKSAEDEDEQTIGLEG